MNQPSESEISLAQVDALLPFLDTFEEAGFSAGEWKRDAGIMPWFDFAESVREFRRSVVENGWINPFDWGSWQETARGYVESPEAVERADLETIQKLLTTHMRKDRFVEGHLASMFENGHIIALLRRLKAIRAEMKTS